MSALPTPQVDGLDTNIGTIEAAIRSETRIPWLLSIGERASIATEPGYRLENDAEILQQIQDYSDEELDEMAEARSGHHARVIARQIAQTRLDRQHLRDAGFSGFAASAGAMLLDPVDLAAGALVTAASGGGGGLVAGAAKLNRLRSLVRTGLAFATTDMLLEAAQATIDPDRGANDVLIAGAASFMLAGGAQAFIDTNVIRKARNVAEHAGAEEARRLRDAGYDLQKPALDMIARDESVENLQANLRSGLSRMNLNEQDRALLDQLIQDNPRDFMEILGGTTRNLTPDGTPISDAAAAAWTLADAVVPEKAKSLVSKLTISMSGRLGRQEHPLSRFASDALFENSLAFAEGRVARTSATEWADLNYRRIATGWRRSLDAAARRWRKQTGRTSWSPAKIINDHREFQRLVTQAARREGTEAFDAFDDAVKDGVQALRQAKSRVLDIAKARNVRGLEEIVDRPGYVARLYDRRALTHLAQIHGNDALHSLFAKSIRSAQPDLEPQQIESLATLHLKALQSHQYVNDVQLQRIFSADMQDELRELLRHEVKISDDETESIVQALVDSQADTSGRPARARPRLELDETVSVTTKDGSTLSIEDLLINDADMIVDTYTRQLIGEAGARVYFDRAGELAQGILELDTPPSIHTIASYQDIHNRIASKLGIDPAKADKDFRFAELGLKQMLGLPLDKMTRTTTGRMLRAARDYNFTRLMGMSGFSQTVDLANVVAEVGITPLIMQLPAVRQAWKKIRSGERLSNQLLAELEELGGWGTYLPRESGINRVDPFEDTVSRSLSRGEEALAIGRNIVTRTGGLGPLTDLSHRWATAGMVQRIARDALGGNPPSRQRLASVGWSIGDWIELRDAVRKHATKEDSLLFGAKSRVTRLNTNEWDPRKLGILQRGIDKWTRTVVLENSIGSLPKFMTTEWGRTLFQFRSFVMGAHEKLLLRGVSLHDRVFFTQAMVSMFLGTMSYLARTSVQAVGRPDADAFLHERLTPAAISSSAFYQSGVSAFIPSMIDTGSYVLGGDPVFSYGRSSGLASDVFNGSPTVDLANRLLAGARTGSKAVRGVFDEGEGPTSAQVRSSLKTLPMSNSILIANLIEILAQQYPETRRDQDR